MYVDPRNPDIVYTFNTTSYKSTDGGNTFTGFKGAPGGDDPQTGWIDPTDGRRILLGFDQGAIVSLDGGATWSSWYNQSTEQVYHISADNSSRIGSTRRSRTPAPCARAPRGPGRGHSAGLEPGEWMGVGDDHSRPARRQHRVRERQSGDLIRISNPSEQWISVSPAVNPHSTCRSSLSQPIVSRHGTTTS